MSTNSLTHCHRVCVCWFPDFCAEQSRRWIEVCFQRVVDWAGSTTNSLTNSSCVFVCVCARTGPPKVSGKPQHRHLAKRGKNTKLVCPVEAHPTPFTEWKKDGEKINSAWSRFKVRILGGRARRGEGVHSFPPARV